MRSVQPTSSCSGSAQIAAQMTRDYATRRRASTRNERMAPPTASARRSLIDVVHPPRLKGVRAEDTIELSQCFTLIRRQRRGARGSECPRAGCRYAIPCRLSTNEL